MKSVKTTALAVAGILGASAFAVELQNAKIQPSQEEPQLVLITSGKHVIAELRLLKPGTLNVSAKDVSFRATTTGKSYNCTGGAKLELLNDGTSVLTVSSDSMVLQDQKANFTAVGLNK